MTKITKEIKARNHKKQNICKTDQLDLKHINKTF